jgi:hypothetical protein
MNMPSEHFSRHGNWFAAVALAIGGCIHADAKGSNQQTQAYTAGRPVAGPLRVARGQSHSITDAARVSKFATESSEEAT